jgi:biotin-dependent carboxylase-like uncharacterized protein
MLGNALDAPVLEFTLIGPELLFLQDHRICVLGASLQISPEVLHLRKGDRLKLGQATLGVRGYLAIAGGFKIEALPGAPTRWLQSGDRVAVHRQAPPRRGSRASDPDRSLSQGFSKIFSMLSEERRNPIRVLRGPQVNCGVPVFSRGELERFVTEPFRVSPNSNRMGVRLEGAPLRHAGAAEIPSDANTFGAIQVPPSGLPIILGADLPITGGYPKIATVIERDHWRVAQARPGEVLRFEWCTLEEARRLRAEPKRLEERC